MAMGPGGQHKCMGKPGEGGGPPTHAFSLSRTDRCHAAANVATFSHFEGETRNSHFYMLSQNF